MLKNPQARNVAPENRTMPTRMGASRNSGKNFREKSIKKKGM